MDVHKPNAFSYLPYDFNVEQEERKTIINKEEQTILMLYIYVIQKMNIETTSE
ncbi:MAG: hypothetical protein IPG89_05725 [Bacteroidetes bacterium]|nr:hypothetical protein [Bacteroidota bacterium]